MMKVFTRKEILPISLIALAYIIGVSCYSCLPEMMPAHWNYHGEVDDWSSKNFTIFFFPSLALSIYLLMLFIPKIDPLRKNYPKFSLSYFWFRVILVLFFVSLYLYTLAAGAGFKMNINYFIVPLISLLFIFIGLFLPKIKKNYFVGIRTPWTIHSEEVWDKTHKMAGRLFVGAGIISLFSLFFPDYAFQIFMASVLAAALGSIVYSYFIFRKNGEFNKES
ncbi:MAG: SdpI family protein [bacterium]